MKNQQNSENNTQTENVKELELQNTSTLEEPTDNKNYGANEKLFHQEEMKNAPILLTKMDKDGKEEWFGMVGQDKVTHSYKTKEELVDAIYNIGIKDWWQAISIISAFVMNRLEVEQARLKGEIK